MKKWQIAVLLLALLMIAVVAVGCDNGTTTQVPDNTDDGLDVNLEELKATYGEFSIIGDGVEGVWSSDNKTYTISVAAAKSSFTLTGYFEGQIIIDTANELSSYKGVELSLEGACLVSKSGPNIDYQPTSKNVEIVAKNGTENYVINLGEANDDCAVVSAKNIEIDGKGTLNVLTLTGHCFNADDTIRLYSAPTLNLTSGHDAIHAKEFVANNGEAAGTADYKVFAGTLNVLSAKSQAFDCTSGKGKGAIDLTSGTFNITNCESAFKTDTTLTIGGTVAVTNLTADVVVKGESATQVTITVLEGGSFTVNGEAYTITEV